MRYEFSKLVHVKDPLPQNTPEWLMARQGRITASDRAHKLIVGSDRTIGLMMQKMAAELGEEPVEWKGNRATRHGHAFEDQAIGEYRMRSLDLREIVRAPGFHVHPKFQIAGATPDFFHGDDITGQIKCPYNPKNHLALLHRNLREVNDKYYVQVQFESFVSGRPRIVFVSYHPDVPAVNQLHVAEIPLDEEMHRKFEERLTWITSMLVQGQTPGDTEKEIGVDNIPNLF